MTLMLTTPACPLTGPFKEAVETALLAVPGVVSADVTLDAEVRQFRGGAETQARRRREEHHRHRLATRAASASRPSPRTSRRAGQARREGRAARRRHHRPEHPDDDGLRGRLPCSRPRAACKPQDKYGVKVCCIGFALPKGTPVVWRGPMIGTAVRDFLHDIPMGRAGLPDRRPAAGHVRRFDEHGAGGADRGRGHRQHAADRRPRRRDEGGGDVRPPAGAGLRRHREHELLRRAGHRSRVRDFRPRRRWHGPPKTSASSSWARSRSTRPRARRATPACP